MNRSLFAITEDLLRLNDRLDEDGGEVGADGALSAWIDSLGLEESKKLDGYVNWIKQLEMEAVVARAEAEQFAAKAKTREGRVKWLKERLKLHLELTGRSKISTESGRTIAVQKNGGKVPIEINEAISIDWVEPRFVKVAKSIDADEVRRALEAGEALEIAKLGEVGFHLRIK